MKAKLKVMLPGFSGNMDDVVVYYNSHFNKYVTRRMLKPKVTADNTVVKEIPAFRRRIDVSAAYLDDCRDCIKRFNRRYRSQGREYSTWPNVFTKVMQAQLKANPKLSLTTLSRTDFLAHSLPCRSICTAVKEVYLETCQDMRS